MATSLQRATSRSSGTFDSCLDPAGCSLLAEHVVQGVPVLPGAAALGLALRAGRAAAAGDHVVLRETHFGSAVAVEAGRELRLRVLLDAAEDGWSFTVSTVGPDGGLTRHVTGRLERGNRETAAAGTPAEARARLGRAHGGAAFYATLAASGNHYGPLFQGVERLWTQEGEALAELRAAPVPTALAEAFGLDVAAVDAALHALAAPGGGAGRRPAFVLASVAEADLPPGAQPAWSHVRLDPGAGDAAPSGDVHLYDAAGGWAGTLRGVRLAWLEPTRTAPPERIVVAATFTADPVGEVLELWAQELALPLEVRHAPFDQVLQQLLDPASLLRANPAGAGLVLLRIEDWARLGTLPRAGALPPEVPSRRLPSGLEVAHLNPYETDYLYQEIFVDRVYERHGITIQPGDCVFDVGANIGMFALFARSAAERVSVCAFEPSPRLLPLLEANARLAGGIEVFPCGVADRDGRAPFTFYARSSVFSGYRADAEQDQAALRAVIDNMLARGGVGEPAERAAAADYFLAGRLEAEVSERELRTLSSVIDERAIERIDLLKIDAEKSEWAVLAGLREEHWPRVQQVVLEVHEGGGGGQAERIAVLLRERGFEVAQEREPLLDGSGLHTLYARRPGDRPGEPAWTARLEAAGGTFLEALRAAAGSLRTPLLVVCCPPSPGAGRMPALAARLQEWEGRVVAAARGLPGVDVVRAAELTERYPAAEVHDERALALGHLPYTSGYLAALGTAAIRRLVARRDATVKVIAVDADETLWNGVCGESGPLGVEVDADRAALQEHLIEEVEAGKLLAVCSKNRLEDVLEVFRAHPGMRLREEHVAAWRVNWRPKSANLRELAGELRVALGDCLLLDDSPLECAEVQAHAPEVVALALPRGSGEAARFLRHVWLLDQGAPTSEDARRTRLYADDTRRAQALRAAPSLQEFLDTLELRCEIAPMDPADAARVAQLTQRTNQMNLAKRERTAAGLLAAVVSGSEDWLTVRVSDRFGDYGLVGAMGFRGEAQALRVEAFLLSCRALGRGVEQRMLAELGRRAEARGLVRLELPFVAAPRNQPARELLESLEPQQTDGSLWVLPAAAASAQRLRPPRADGGDGKAAPVVAEAGPVRLDRRRDPEIARRLAVALATVEQIEAALAVRRRTLRGGAAPLVSLRGTGPVRETLGAIWSDVLGLPGVGLQDDFFALGGTSLQLVQAVSRVGRAFGRSIPLDDAFQLRSVEAVAAWLEGHGIGGPAAGEAAGDATPAPPVATGAVSHGQEALYYLQQLAPETWAYNVPFGARVMGRRLAGGALGRAFERLLARHPMLRATYAMHRGRVHAVDGGAPLADFAEVDASAWDAPALAERLRYELRQPFDLRRGPLARLRLFQWRGESVLLFVTHHVAVDLWSMEIVADDLLRFHRDEEEGRPGDDGPPPPAESYADFVRGQRQLLDGPEGERQWAYWQGELGGDLPVLALQMARSESGPRRMVGASHAFAVDQGLVEELRALAAREGSTLFQVLLAGYATLLFRHTSQDDLLIGAPFGVRDPERFGGVVGNFINLIPLRIRLGGGPGFRELLSRVGQRVRHGLAHRDTPFSLLVQRLRRRGSRSAPLVQTTFALHEPSRLPDLAPFFLQGNLQGRLRLHGLELEPVGLTQQEGQFDLALEMVPQGRGLRGAFKYDAQVLDAASAARLADRYQALLAAAVARPDVPLGALALGRPGAGPLRTSEGP
jgi:FkbH-like protein/FkbM family methyltransferase